MFFFWLTFWLHYEFGIMICEQWTSRSSACLIMELTRPTLKWPMAWGIENNPSLSRYWSEILSQHNLTKGQWHNTKMTSFGRFSFQNSLPKYSYEYTYIRVLHNFRAINANQNIKLLVIVFDDKRNHNRQLLIIWVHARTITSHGIYC